MRSFFKYVVILLGGVIILSSIQAHAALVGYTSEADFFTAIAGMSNQQTADFESLAADTLISSGDTVEGITFTYALPDSMMVTDWYDTTSEFNSLGLDNEDSAFMSGDIFDMSFDHAISALGLFVIAEPGEYFVGDFRLSISTGLVFNSDTPDQSLSDGDAFFLGLVETDPNLAFTSASLQSLDVGFFMYNVDDITTATAATASPVPEPSTLLLFGTGMIGAFFKKRRQAK